VPMLFVAAATGIAMLGEVAGYFRAFEERWLLAGIGSTILILDFFVLLEGLRVLRNSEPADRIESPG